MILPESWVSAAGAPVLHRCVAEAAPGAMAKSASASNRMARSTAATVVEMVDGQAKLSRGSVSVLLGPFMAKCLVKAPQPFAAGRGLWLSFALPSGGQLHIIALYGVSAAASDMQSKQLAADLAADTQGILDRLTGERVIGVGDFNSVMRECDRKSRKLTAYDGPNMDTALVKVFADNNFVDAPAMEFEQTFVPSYVSGQTSSRIDGFWISPALVTEHKGAASRAGRPLCGCLRRPGPFSSDHMLVMMNLTAIHPVSTPPGGRAGIAVAARPPGTTVWSLKGRRLQRYKDALAGMVATPESALAKALQTYRTAIPSALWDEEMGRLENVRSGGLGISEEHRETVSEALEVLLLTLAGVIREAEAVARAPTTPPRPLQANEIPTPEWYRTAVSFVNRAEKLRAAQMVPWTRDIGEYVDMVLEQLMDAQKQLGFLEGYDLAQTGGVESAAGQCVERLQHVGFSRSGTGEWSRQVPRVEEEPSFRSKMQTITGRGSDGIIDGIVQEQQSQDDEEHDVMVKVWRTSHTALDDIVTTAIKDWTSDKAKVFPYSAAAAAALLQPTGSFGDGVPHAQRRKTKGEVKANGKAALQLWRRAIARAQRLSRVDIAGVTAATNFRVQGRFRGRDYEGTITSMLEAQVLESDLDPQQQQPGMMEVFVVKYDEDNDEEHRDAYTIYDLELPAEFPQRPESFKWSTEELARLQEEAKKACIQLPEQLQEFLQENRSRDRLTTVPFEVAHATW